MSRSFHATRRTLAHLQRWDTSEAEHGTRIERCRDALNTKRAVKAAHRTSRRRRLPVPAVVPPATNPVRVAPAPVGMHYPAGPEDLRAVLTRLPAGVLAGLSAVELTPALWWSERSDFPTEPDPLLGRLGFELLPGVFATPVLGSYRPGAARISLPGFVYADALPDRPLWELYLRLLALQTLCHEVAHHWDWTARRGRGRWRAPGAEQSEAYAEQREFEWTRTCVLPYLRSAYPAECGALAAWFREHGGVDPGLELLAHDHGNPDTPAWKAAIRSVFSMETAVSSLARDVYTGTDRLTTRCEFARELHYAEYYPEALTALESVLAEAPDDPCALTLMADIWVHQERCSEARTLAARIVAAHPHVIEAWRVLAEAAEALGDLEGAREAVGQGLTLCTEDPEERTYLLRDLAELCLRLGDRNGFTSAAHALEAVELPLARRLLARLRKTADPETVE